VKNKEQAKKVRNPLQKKPGIEAFQSKGAKEKKRRVQTPQSAPKANAPYH